MSILTALSVRSVLSFQSVLSVLMTMATVIVMATMMTMLTRKPLTLLWKKDMLILNLPTNIYKSSNNKKYQQISTNLPTI